MRVNKRTMTLVLVVLVGSVVTAAAALRYQDEGGVRSKNEEKVKEFLSTLPIGDYDAPEPSDPEKRAKRRAKSQRYNDPNARKIDPSDAPVIGAAKYDWEWGLASTLPAAQSSTVIIGTVLDAQAYLSEDKNSVYSEFTVRVEEVLKNDPDEPISVGDSIVAERSGGRVRLRSGRISSFYVTGQNPPRGGRRYVFFLGFNRYDADNRSLASPRDLSRHILTGYELRGGRVFALDGAGGKNFQKHEGKDETTFLNETRYSIANPSQVLPE